MSLQEILKLLEKKYPINMKINMNPVLCIYDDGSGRITRNALDSMYDTGNVLFIFGDLEELIMHLQETE